MTIRTWLNRNVVGIGEAMVEFAPVGENVYRRGFAGDTLNTCWHIAQMVGDHGEVGTSPESERTRFRGNFYGAHIPRCSPQDHPKNRHDANQVRDRQSLSANAHRVGGAAQKVASKLISAGFAKEVKAKSGDPIWRRDEESGASYALKLTAAGAKAIAVDDAVAPEDAGEEGDALESPDQMAISPKLGAKDARPAEGTEPGPAGPSAPRGGSKLAQVINLLQRDHGATVDELIAATGWLAHTTRAALTGLRKRGYAVALDRSDDKQGSFYRIPADETGLAEGPASSETARRQEQRRLKPQAHQAA
jgi:hypothetical protein